MPDTLNTTVDGSVLFHQIDGVWCTQHSLGLDNLLHGVVVSIVRRVNKVTLCCQCWSRLVLGWVTFFGRVCHLGK